MRIGAFAVAPVVAAALAIAAAVDAKAANFVPRALDNHGYLIFIGGDIVYGDEKTFASLVANVPAYTRTVIIGLSSRGGNELASLAIGRTVRGRGYATMVAADDLCASACANIWLAGQPRVMGPNAHIGFHAGYDSSNPAVPNAPANALIGAYYAEIGLSQTAMIYLTEAGPSGMYWLTPADAAKLGIAVALADKDGNLIGPAPVPPAQPDVAATGQPPPAADQPPSAPPAAVATIAPAQEPAVPAPVAPVTITDPLLIDPPQPPPDRRQGWEGREIGWIQIASRDNLGDALAFARDMHSRYGKAIGKIISQEIIVVFESTAVQGWYVVAIGVHKQTAQQDLRHLWDNDIIPFDSKVVSGRHFGRCMWSTLRPQ